MQTTAIGDTNQTASHTEPAADREFFNIKDAALIIRHRHGLVVGPRKLRAAIKSGELKAIKANDRGDTYTCSAWLDELSERFVATKQIRSQQT